MMRASVCQRSAELTSISPQIDVNDQPISLSMACSHLVETVDHC